VHAREIVLQVFRYVQARGMDVENPAEAIRPSAIATFKPRDRALSPAEIHTFFKALERTATLPTLRLAIKFLLLTLVRKSEFIDALWDEIDFEAATWTIPKERMKAGRPHNVYLSQQTLDILVTFKSCFSASSYLHPGRYEMRQPISAATLNRVIDATVKVIREDEEDFESFTVHDLRRTASTLLHEAGFNSDWIEKCLAHEQRGTRAIYNKAEYAEQRREMLQSWADMLDAWIKDGARARFRGYLSRSTTNAD
jgi:integrase